MVRSWGFGYRWRSNCSNPIFVAGGLSFISWKLGPGEGEGATISGSHNITALSAHMDQAGRLVVSNNCSQTAFVVGSMAILYDIAAQAILAKGEAHDNTPDVQLSQDGGWLYVRSCDSTWSSSCSFAIYLTKFEMEISV